MASSKEIQTSSRPLSQRRLSITNTSSLPKSHGRNHSHSVSMGSHLNSHRVTRRKSISTNNSIMIAAVKEAAEFTQGIPIVGRRPISKGSSARSVMLGNLPSPPMSFPSHRLRSALNSKLDREESAVEDDQRDDFGDDEGANGTHDPRPSEGQNTIKDSKKANANDLKCDKCGKGYKHSSCLSKHLWEHTPEWSYTSKLLISKHQQVQLLEAASVLLTMNQDANNTPPASARGSPSDQESSPTTSGTSEVHERLSSADTTPPPYTDMHNAYRRASYTSGYSRYRRGSTHLYQNASSPNASVSSSVPVSRSYRKFNHEQRPVGFSPENEDESLASVVKLLSCSFGCVEPPSLQPPIPEHTPPVPNIPVQYLNQNNYCSSIFSPGSHPRQTESYTRAQNYHNEDVRMGSGESGTDDEYDQTSQGLDEDDDGVFGRMEE